MVTLNLTLFIELGLFLLFLWGTARFILRPVLRTLDERAQKIEDDQAGAAQDAERADALDAQYADALSEVRRATDDTFQQARRETLRGHIDAVTDARKWADDTVAETHAKAEAIVEQERAALHENVADVADLIADRLRPAGPAS